VKNREPEPSGQEGLIDVRIIEAILRSAKTGKIVHIKASKKRLRPNIRLVMTRPPVTKPPKPFHAEAPSRKKAA
jgi:hypothetical protein